MAKSTDWARANKDKVKARDDARKGTLEGKLISLITTSRYRCKLSGHEHSIDVAYIRNIYEEQQGLCAITGMKMIIRGSNCAADSPYSISLDRIDSTKGYIPGNVWLVCTGVNLMKARLTMDQFVEFCRKVVEKFDG